MKLVAVEMHWVADLIIDIDQNDFCNRSKLELDAMNATADSVVPKLWTRFYIDGIDITEHVFVNMFRREEQRKRRKYKRNVIR